MSIETQIAEWRGYLSRHRSISTADTDELEAHLRDRIDDLTASGLDTDEAFLIAVKRLGAVDAISLEFAREHAERLWKQLVLPAADPLSVAGPGLATMLGFAVAAAVTTVAGLHLGLAWLPEERIALNAPLVLLPFVGAYLAWTRRASGRLLAVLAGAVLTLAAVLNTYPFDWAGSTVVLAGIHAPIVLWFAVGLAYVGGEWRSGARRMDFIRFTGEWVVYLALLALGGGVMVGLTVAIFTTIGINPEVAISEWVVPAGVAGATVVAAWLVEAKQAVIENIAPVLTRVFSPLTVILLLAVLTAFAVGGGLVEVERDLLILMAAVLVLVLGLWLYAVSAREPSAPAGIFEWVLLALLASALLVDAVVLVAMLARIAEFGASPNKVTALGLNLLLLGNLAWSARLCVGFLRGTRTFAAIEKWQTDYLPAYAVWAALVILAIPPLFSFA